jgi:hypothetical protein
MLNRDGFILLTGTQRSGTPRRAEQNGTTLGEVLFHGRLRHRTGWNEHIARTNAHTPTDLLNVFSTATVDRDRHRAPTYREPRRYPHKQAWMNKYLGILIFKLRPLASH